MRLFAFQGLRYARPSVEIDPLAAQPYDQLDDAARDELHAISPHQFSHLTKPLADEGGDAYGAAARLHTSWMGDGVVLRDDEPSLYISLTELADGGRRLGVCGLAGLEAPDAGIIRPHEETLAKPLADRVALLEATKIDLEPVFFLSQDEGRLEALIKDDLDGAETVAEHTDADGHRHRLYRIHASERIAAYQKLLAPLPVAIADGHHRYQTARLYAEQSGATQGSAASAKMAVITSLSSPGLTIDPIHRALRQTIDVAAAAHLVVETHPVGAKDMSELAAAVAIAPQPALGVWKVGRLPEIWQLDPSQAGDAIPENAKRLSVSLLHGVVLPALGLGESAATDGTVVYRSDPAQLSEQLAAGDLKVGFALPPMSPTEFAGAIANGDMLPPKATRFLPKLISGLVWADHQSKLT